jgi:hypothetical protein
MEGSRGRRGRRRNSRRRARGRPPVSPGHLRQRRPGRGRQRGAHWPDTPVEGPQRESACLQDFVRSTLTDSNRPLLTMEDSSWSYARQESRLIPRFPCKLARFSPHCSLPSKGPGHPGHPRTCPQNLSPAGLHGIVGCLWRLAMKARLPRSANCLDMLVEAPPLPPAWRNTSSIRA